MRRKVIVFLILICLAASIVLVTEINRLESFKTIEAEDMNAWEPDELSASETVLLIEPTEEPVIKTIYLTFDDGPYKYTEKLLDILDEYNVKATFFVTDQNKDYTHLIKDEYDRGHAIGIHTACHIYKTIYKSDEHFLRDFYTMQSIVYDYTGARTRLYRFPGGSSNTVSLKYGKGVVSDMTGFLDNNGYVYFDWNITSKDSEGLKKAEDIAQTTIEQILELEDINFIVLQHDIYECSVDATESIIKWGLENGYRFDKLSTDTPTVHFEVAN